VTLLPAGQLRDIVEEGYFSISREAKIAEIKQVLAAIPLADIDSLVLGCTHFIHLEEEFRIVLGDKIRVIDSREGVVNQLIRILDRDALRAVQKTGNNTLYLTEPKVARQTQYLLFAEKYGLQYGGAL